MKYLLQKVENPVVKNIKGFFLSIKVFLNENWSTIFKTLKKLIINSKKVP